MSCSRAEALFCSPGVFFSPPDSPLVSPAEVTLTGRNVLPVLCQERTEGGEKGTSDGLTQRTVSAEIFSPADDRVTPPDPDLTT